MARKARYTQALPVYAEHAVRERILKVADEMEVSQAEVVRELIGFALERGAVEQIWGIADEV